MVKISVIIPTHNRSASVNHLLGLLNAQDIIQQQVEIIVVANACTDDTISMLENYSGVLPLHIIDRKEAGAAGARNAGAEAASGNYLVFLDDDILPSPGLLQAHLDAQEKLQGVVIGYLPFKVDDPDAYMPMMHRAWWAEKYFDLSDPSHRFGYDDLLSGNFSIPKHIFLQAGGFDHTLACREDYELGITLIKLGIPFGFSKEACGLHYDRSLTPGRSFHRKRMEGRSDVLIAQRYPGYPIRLRDLYHASQGSFRKRMLFDLSISASALIRPFAKCLEPFMWFCEKIKWRSAWQKLNYRLHAFWYLTGMKDKFQSSDEFRAFLARPGVEKFSEADINMQDSLQAICKKVDELAPGAISFYANGQKMMELPGVFGKEQLKGIHLQEYLGIHPVWFVCHDKEIHFPEVKELAGHGN